MASSRTRFVPALLLVFLTLWKRGCGVSDPGPEFPQGKAPDGPQGALLFPFPEGLAPDGTRYKTDYRCEGQIMNVSCSAGERIRVVRGNFGRFSIVICNRHGHTDWSVNCMAPSTTKILKDKCDGLQECIVPVESDHFPDACPGTSKYLEIHYACEAEEGNSASSDKSDQNNQLLPPWLRNGGRGPVLAGGNTRPSVSKVRKPWKVSGHSEPDEGKTETRRGSGKEPATTTTTTAAPRKPILVTEKVVPKIPSTTTTTTTTTTTARSTTARRPTTRYPKNIGPASRIPGVVSQTKKVAPASSFFPVTSSSINVAKPKNPSQGPSATAWCPPTTARQLQWDWTAAGQDVVQPCPIGATGHARWTCGEPAKDVADQSGVSVARWDTPQPDMSNCKSVAMTNLESQVRSEDPENVLVSALAYLTRTKSLYGGDLETAVATMRTVASRIQYRLQQSSRVGAFHNKESHIRQVLQNVFRATNNMLEASQRQAWTDLSRDGQMKVATQLLLSLEENAFLLAGVINDPDVINESSDILTMSISVVDVAQEAESSQETDGQPHRMTFPLSASAMEPNRLYVEDSVEIGLQDLKDNAQAHLAEVVFFSYGNLHELLYQAKVYLSEAYNADTQSDRLALNSKVVSASLGRPGRHVQLAVPARVSLKHLRGNMTKPVCVFWDLEEHAWSDSGCKVAVDGESETVCECHHLTHFAVFMEEEEAVDGGALFGSVFGRVDVFGSVAAAVLLFVLLLIVLMCRSRMSSCCGRLSCSRLTTKEGDLRKSQSFYQGLSLNSGAAGTVNSTKGRSLLMNGGTNRSQSQYVLGTPVLSHNGTVRMGAGGAGSTLLPSGAPRAHITLNPYSTQLVDNINMMMPGGNACLNPQLMHLTETLKRGNTSSGSSGDDSSEQPQSAATVNADDMVYRAVSPHGHVYYEIDPAQNYLILNNLPPGQQQQQQQFQHDNSCDERTPLNAAQASFQSTGDDRYPSGERRPLISSPLQHQLNPAAGSASSATTSSGGSASSNELLVRASNSMEFNNHTNSSRATPLRSGGVSSSFVRTGANRFTRSRMDDSAGVGGGGINPSSSVAVPEQLQTQVQIRDCKPIQVSVKSSEYIEAKIRTLRKNNNNLQ